jgi:hypothetical protein
MEEHDIPDANIFMMCEALNHDAPAELPAAYSI